MTATVVVLIIIGIIMSFVSFFLSEKVTKKEDNLHSNLMAVEEDYEFSERELRIIKRKIEDVIANQAKDILYETNESLSSMANEKTMALGDYAVAVCEQIEKNHKEVMFLYSMLDDKQKEIIKTVKMVDELNQNVKDTIEKVASFEAKQAEKLEEAKKQATIEQMNVLAQRKRDMEEDIVPTAIQRDETPRREVSRQETPRQETPRQIEELVRAVENERLAENIMNNVNENEPSEENMEMADDDQLDLEDIEDVFAQLDETEIDFDEVLEEETSENENMNDIILQMHRNGNNIIDIAKQLGLGVGEVKLVIDLYRGE